MGHPTTLQSRWYGALLVLFNLLPSPNAFIQLEVVWTLTSAFFDFDELLLDPPGDGRLWLGGEVGE